MRTQEQNVMLLDDMTCAVDDVFGSILREEYDYCEVEQLLDHGREPRVKYDCFEYFIDIWINVDTNCIHIAEIRKYGRCSHKGLLQKITTNLLKVCKKHDLAGVSAYACRSVRYNGYYSFVAAGYDGELSNRDMITHSGVNEPTFHHISDFVNKYGLEWWKQHGISVNVLYQTNKGA